MICGLVPHTSLPLVLGALLAGSAPSWISLAGAAAGVRRINGGPVGKTERCLVIAIAAATGWFTLAAVVLIVGSLLTAGLRLLKVKTLCNGRFGEDRAPMGGRW